MSKANKFSEYLNEPDFFDLIKAEIDKDLSNLKKVVDNINQMRVEASQMESDLMMMLNATSWEKVACLIGHGQCFLDNIKNN
ncbi:unnamed protein product [Colias eurytheme]|nr:unnamed protein product [Colias eurytheme]